MHHVHVATIERVHGQMFNRPREQRSLAYRAGAKAGLALAIAREVVQCPHAPGSAERDAYLAGLEEGRIVGKAVDSGDIALLLRMSINLVEPVLA